MMEIVHDMAPGAKLAFATAFNSPRALADNIRALRFTYHCDVIVDDVIYYDESPYQDDIIAAAVDDVVADGAVYFSSAGNEGNYDDGTSGTWEGDFKSAGTLATLPSGYTVHNFGDKVISDRIEVGGGPLVLQWSDPSSLDAPMSSNDYDLFVLDQDLRNVLVASTDLQDGAGLPFEYLGFNIPAGLRVVVAKHPNAEARALRATIYSGELGLSTDGRDVRSQLGGRARSALPPSMSRKRTAASSPAARRRRSSCTAPTVRGACSTTATATRSTPDKVTFASGGGQHPQQARPRRRPTASRRRCRRTTGLNPFFGTSAAAPHAGAIAALVKSAVPTASTPDPQTALTSGRARYRSRGRRPRRRCRPRVGPGALKKAGAPAAVFLELESVAVTLSARRGASRGRARRCACS